MSMPGRQWSAKLCAGLFVRGGFARKGPTGAAFRAVVWCDKAGSSAWSRRALGDTAGSALNPVERIEPQVTDGLRPHLVLSRSGAHRRALVFISRHLSMVRALCDRVLVMYRGDVAEAGPCEQVFSHPQHDYTKALLSANPLPALDPGWLARRTADDEQAAVGDD